MISNSSRWLAAVSLLLAAVGVALVGRALTSEEGMLQVAGQPLRGRDRATVLGQMLGRAIGVNNPDRIDFERWHDYVPLGDDALQYQPGRDVMSTRSFLLKLYLEVATADGRAKLARFDAGMNDPAIGGMFERGGGYYVADSSQDEGYFVRDYPVAAVSSSMLRAGFEYQLNLGATWRLQWGRRVAGIVHQFKNSQPVTSPVVWDDERDALAADVSRLRGRERADALVRAYLAHRLVKGATLDRDGRYDAGDFYLRYDPAGEALEAGVFVATPADLARLAAAGLTPERLQGSVDGFIRRGTFAGPPAIAPGAVPDAGHPLPAPGAPAAFLRVLPLLGAPAGSSERMAYLVQRWPVATLTPTALDLAMEQLFDYATVWRHRWLWRAARIALGSEPPPAGRVERTPGDYGFDPAAERLDAPPPAPAAP